MSIETSQPYDKMGSALALNSLRVQSKLKMPCRQHWCCTTKPCNGLLESTLGVQGQTKVLELVDLAQGLAIVSDAMCATGIVTP